MITEKDKGVLEDREITSVDVEAKLQLFKEGYPFAHIVEPATVGNGIKMLTDLERARYIEKYDCSKSAVMKFVPASGAATRMFKNLYSFLDQYEHSVKSFEQLKSADKVIEKFFAELDAFAFYEALDRELKNLYQLSIFEALTEHRADLIVRTLLDEQGLNYGQLPKGLLAFHKYKDHVRTPAQEHLMEGLAYALKGNEINIHFTVSPAHQTLFEKHINQSIDTLDIIETIHVGYSIQRPKTDMIASTLGFEPFRDENGNLLFRPAGHGALLENLNDLSTDLIFIKNIDNVVPDFLKKDTITYKKVLAGILLHYQERAFELLRRNERREDVKEEAFSLLKEMGLRNFEPTRAMDLLNRPIRVCGMVKNEGEPGGGPFWVKGKNGHSLQIVESAQVNKADPIQLNAFKSGTHFNPVDLVCGIKNYKGKKFNLLDYRDDDAGFITEKFYNGEKLLAMELPGLWNGGMAYWNTIFVEVPLVTFNPVKTVIDLLKPTHRQKEL